MTEINFNDIATEMAKILEEKIKLMVIRLI